jgi:general secretion pathway protein D
MILTSNLQGESLRIIGPKPMTKREAVQYIEATLLLNGYAVVPWDDETVTLIHHSGGEDPSSLGLPVYNAIRDLPEGDQVVHYVMSLNHISPEEASKAFQEVIKLHAYGAIKPVTNAASLIITENTATIRAIYNIAQVIDVPPAEISNELIKLERSDAERIAEIINDIYEAKEEEAAARSTASAVTNAPGQPAAPGQPGVPGQRPAAPAAEWSWLDQQCGHESLRGQGQSHPRSSSEQPAHHRSSRRYRLHQGTGGKTRSTERRRKFPGAEAEVPFGRRVHAGRAKCPGA